MSTPSGEPVAVATTTSAFPAMAVGHDRVVFPSADAKGAVILDPSDGQVVRTLRFNNEVWDLAFNPAGDLLVVFLGYNGIGVVDL